MQKTIDKVESQSVELEQIVLKVVEKYCDTIDSYVENIRNVLDTEVNDLSIQDLNRILIKITTYSYFLSTRQEILGIRRDVADIVHKEKFNNAYINTTTGTVANKTAKAEEFSKEEEVVALVYDRAYKIIKMKNDAVCRLIDSIKKIVSSRLAEMQLANREV
jgi:hypothetical protein